MLKSPAPLHNPILKSKQFKEVRRKLKCQMQQPHHFSLPLCGTFSYSLPAVHKVHAVGYCTVCCVQTSWYFRARKIDGIIKHSWLTLRLINCFGILRCGCSLVLAGSARPLLAQMGRNRELAFVGRKLKFHRRLQVNFCMKKCRLLVLGSAWSCWSRALCASAIVAIPVTSPRSTGVKRRHHAGAQN